jgi:outer membrane lipoprotein-sorting protein
MRPTEKIKQRIKNTQIKTDPKVNQAVLNDLLDRLDAAQGTPVTGPEPNIWRTIMKKRTFKLSTAAAILIAVMLGMQLVGTPSAYAQVVQSLRNARTLAYTLITTTNTETGETVKTDWLFKDPGLLRTTTADGYITILSVGQGRQLSLVPPTKQYIIAEFNNTRQSDSPDQFAAIESLRRLPEKVDEQLGAARINGIPVKGYRVFGEDVVTTIWINPENKELVQVEQEYPSSPGMNFVMNNISFDIELDDALFDLTPPVGYTPLGVLQENSQITEQNLVDFLRHWGEASSNGIYQPISMGPQFSKLVMDLIAEGKLNSEAMAHINPQVMYNGMMFIAQLPPSSNWRYAGENVDVGDTQTPIFWYKPVESDTYRVIYGDLHIENLSSEELPK